MVLYASLYTTYSIRTNQISPNNYTFVDAPKWNINKCQVKITLIENVHITQGK